MTIVHDTGQDRPHYKSSLSSNAGGHRTSTRLPKNEYWDHYLPRNDQNQDKTRKCNRRPFHRSNIESPGQANNVRRDLWGGAASFADPNHQKSSAGNTIKRPSWRRNIEIGCARAPSISSPRIHKNVHKRTTKNPREPHKPHIKNTFYKQHITLKKLPSNKHSQINASKISKCKKNNTPGTQQSKKSLGSGTDRRKQVGKWHKQQKWKWCTRKEGTEDQRVLVAAMVSMVNQGGRRMGK